MTGSVEAMIERNSFQALSKLQTSGIGPKGEWMNKRELAKYLGCNVSLIRGMMLDGLPYRSVGRSTLYKRSEIEAWLRTSQ